MLKGDYVVLEWACQAAETMERPGVEHSHTRTLRTRECMCGFPMSLKRSARPHLALNLSSLVWFKDAEGLH